MTPGAWLLNFARSPDQDDDLIDDMRSKKIAEAVRKCFRQEPGCRGTKVLDKTREFGAAHTAAAPASETLPSPKLFVEN